MPEINLMPKFNAIIAADLPEIEKLTRAYEYLISEHIAIARREIELLKALGDQQALVKEQIKADTMEYSLGVFRHCRQQAAGRQAP